MLVTNLAQGADLAQALGDNKVALMRGHGFMIRSNHLQDAVSTAIYLPKNARILTTAKLLGGTVTLATPKGEVAKAGPVHPEFAVAFQRGWEYWLTRSKRETLRRERRADSVNVAVVALATAAGVNAERREIVAQPARNAVGVVRETGSPDSPSGEIDPSPHPTRRHPTRRENSASTRAPARPAE